MGGARAAGRIGPLTEFVQVVAGMVRASGFVSDAAGTSTSLTLMPFTATGERARVASALGAATVAPTSSARVARPRLTPPSG